MRWKKSNECASTLPPNLSPPSLGPSLPFGAQLLCSLQLIGCLCRRAPVAPIVPGSLLCAIAATAEKHEM